MGKIIKLKVVKMIRILFNDFSKLNFEIFLRNIIEGKKFISHTRIAPLAGAINLTPS